MVQDSNERNILHKIQTAVDYKDFLNISDK